MKSDTTSWRLIRQAASGIRPARSSFVLRYEPLVRRWFAMRWAHSLLLGEVDDATQEVFVDCLRRGGALERATDRGNRSFRRFLRGVVRNVARRHEEAARRRSQQASTGFLEGVTGGASSPSGAVARRHARAVMREAFADMEGAAGEDSRRRRQVALLRARFGDRLPIREIAAQWQEEPGVLHREYAAARGCFKEALMRTLARQRPGTRAELEERCVLLLSVLGSKRG